LLSLQSSSCSKAKQGASRGQTQGGINPMQKAQERKAFNNSSRIKKETTIGRRWFSSFHLSAASSLLS
jgi:hypothetical protein